MESPCFEVVEMDQILKSPDLLEKVRILTIDPFSGMNRALNYFLALNRPINAKGIFASYDRLRVGWALLSFENDNFYFQQRTGHACIQVYVCDHFRRRGIGTRLVQIATELAQDHTFSVYSFNNHNFFSQFMKQPNFQEII